MRGKFLAVKMPFVPKITKTKRKNRKKRKQATTKTPSESSTDYPSTVKPLVEDNMVDRGGEGNRSPRRTLGDYAYK